MRPALRHFAFAVLLVLLAACGAAREVTAPEDADAASAVAVAADSFEPDRPDAVRAPANDPMPPAAARKADAAAQQNDVGEVDYTCRSDADCAEQRRRDRHAAADLLRIAEHAVGQSLIKQATLAAVAHRALWYSLEVALRPGARVLAHVGVPL